MNTVHTPMPAAAPAGFWWSEGNGIALSPLWWAVEHLGHAAFYLRALMPGDFKYGGVGPLPRHAYGLRGEQLEAYPVPCQTCGKVVHPSALTPIERRTGARGQGLFFAKFLSGEKPWPLHTRKSSCWQCSDPFKPANHQVESRMLCDTCAPNRKE